MTNVEILSMYKYAYENVLLWRFLIDTFNVCLSTFDYDY